jgi:hypothetical protein
VRWLKNGFRKRRDRLFGFLLTSLLFVIGVRESLRLFERWLPEVSGQAVCWKKPNVPFTNGFIIVFWCS